MSAPVLAAFAAGVCAVVALWEAVGLVQGAAVLARVGEVLAPLRAVGVVGRAPTVPERRRLAVVFGLTLLAGGTLVHGLVAGIVVAAAGPFLVGRVVAARRRRWRRALAAGAPHVARTLADALSGGHAVRGALAEAARTGGAGPVVDAELLAASRALALGERTEVVLERLRGRARDPGWETMVAAVLLQRRSGGDLAGLLRELAADLESARRAEADARSATAQARFTAWTVCALPAGGCVLGELAKPGLIEQTVSRPLGAALCAAALALQLLALLVVSRLGRLERY